MSGGAALGKPIYPIDPAIEDKNVVIIRKGPEANFTDKMLWPAMLAQGGGLEYDPGGIGATKTKNLDVFWVMHSRNQTRQHPHPSEPSR